MAPEDEKIDLTKRQLIFPDLCFAWNSRPYEPGHRPQSNTIYCQTRLPNEVELHLRATIALESLAGMNAVGLRTRFADFRLILTGVLGADIVGQADLEVFGKVSETRELLARIGIVNHALENHLNLYAPASKAIRVGLDRI